MQLCQQDMKDKTCQAFPIADFKFQPRSAGCVQSEKGLSHHTLEVHVPQGKKKKT